MVQTISLVAIAILLRDEIEGILDPSKWGFFGGHLKLGETSGAIASNNIM